MSVIDEHRPALLGPSLAMPGSAEKEPSVDDVVAFARDQGSNWST